MGRVVKNKVVIVTGGAAGIGYAIAESFVQNEAKVVILDIDYEQGAHAAKTFTDKYGSNKVEFLKCDITTDLYAVSNQIIEKYKTVDVLINNAGILNEGSVRKTIEINVIALMEWSMKFWEHMRIDKGGKGGTIINISSGYGFYIDQFVPFYKASKHAVMGFTLSLGHEYNYNRFGVRIMAICPGYIKTSISENFRASEAILRDEYLEHCDKLPNLKPDAVGKAAVEIFEKAESGTAWLVSGLNAIVQVSCPAILNK